MGSASIWETDPRQWPKASREYVFLAAAFDEVGRALCKDDWTGREVLPPSTPLADAQKRVAAIQRQQLVQPACRPSRGGISLPRSAPAPTELPKADLPQWTPEQIEGLERQQAKAIEEEKAAADAMKERRQTVVDWIADRARNGSLVTFGLWLHGQAEPTPLAPWVWNVQNDWTLFSACQARVAGVHPVTYWLFITRQSLDAALKNADDPAKLTAKAENKALDWLLAKIAGLDPKTTPRDKMKESCIEEIPGLSGRAFDRAWGNMTARHPEWKGPGRKS